MVLMTKTLEKPAVTTDEALVEKLRKDCSPRHVPDQILQVPDVPYTLTGKKLEVPVKRILLGHPIEKSVNRDSMGNPESMDWFIEFGAARQRL